MSEIPSSFTDVIGLWKSGAQMARDLDQKEITVHQWRRRNSIPPGYWNAIVNAAAERGFNQVTIKLLANIAEQQQVAAE